MKDLNVAAIILAGGQGTRLLPLTLHHCKPALSFGGRYRLIDIPISNAIHSGLCNLFIIAQYLSGDLQHYIESTYRFDFFQKGSLHVLTPEENQQGEKIWFTGTADAVRKNLPVLLNTAAEFFLILAGDQLYNFDFRDFISYARKKKSELTIAALPVVKEDAKRFGMIRIDDQGAILHFQEKPQKEEEIQTFILDPRFYKQNSSEPHFLASMGIYLFTRKSLVTLLQNDPREDFGRHLLQGAIQNERSFAYIYQGYWEDIGTISSYYHANLNLTKDHNKGLNTYDEEKPIFTKPYFLPGARIESTKIARSIFCDGSIIHAEEISDSLIGLRSHIQRGTILRKSIMIDSSIGENCLIENAIIDEHVRIGREVRLVNKQKLMHFDGNGVFIRDGILIVTSGTILPDHFTL